MYSEFVSSTPENFSKVSSDKNNFTRSPAFNFSVPSALWSFKVIFFLRSILYTKLPDALLNNFFKYLSKRCPDSFGLIVNCFI